MILGIDASNISSGGGLTHLRNLLLHVEPKNYGFERVIVWASDSTLDVLEGREWLVKRRHPLLQKGIVARSHWKMIKLPLALKIENCQLLFVPGGSYLGSFRPFITMSRNLLPFQYRELLRFGATLMTLKLLLLRVLQSLTYNRASGLIFLTDFAAKNILEIIGSTESAVRVIPHGIDAAFFNAPAVEPRFPSPDSAHSPLKLIYVSMIDFYKHQWKVIHAVKLLRNEGYPVTLELLGPARISAHRKLERYVRKFSLEGEFWNYAGPCEHELLPAKYREADICIFASSCENMPNILMEGMASGLPIACSRRSPMLDILGDAGVYFEPTDEVEIFEAIKKLIDSVSLRRKLAENAQQLASQYSWSRCADETFEFLGEIAHKHTATAQDV